MKKTLLTFLGIVACVLVVSFAITPVFVFVTHDYKILANLSQAAAVVISIAFLVLMKKGDALKFRVAGFGIGLLVGSFILLRDVVLPLSTFILAPFMSASELEEVGMASGLSLSLNREIILSITHAIMVGITEEVLYRGLLQNVALDATGRDTVRGAQKGIIIAGVLFGVFHFTNLITGGSGFVPVLMQVLSAIPTGIILGAVYFRSKDNLWVCVLLHAMTDAVAFVIAGSVSGATTVTETVSATSQFSAGRVGTILVSLAAALFVIRSKAITKAIEARKVA